jgi:hypothetical protein
LTKLVAAKDLTAAVTEDPSKYQFFTGAASGCKDLYYNLLQAI